MEFPGLGETASARRVSRFELLWAEPSKVAVELRIQST